MAEVARLDTKISVLQDKRLSLTVGGPLVWDVDCNHWVNQRRVPCPSHCPINSWPEHMFRLTLLGKWKLRKQYAAHTYNTYEEA